MKMSSSGLTSWLNRINSFWNLMNWNWVLSQMNDPVLRYVVEWIRRPRANTNTLDEFMRTRGVPEVDRRYYAQRQKDFVLKDNLLFLNITPSNSTETISVFVVPARKWQAAIDGCHRSARHQGRDHTLSLMKERFWWPGMSQALVMAVSNCGRCKQFEAKPQIPGMQPIICTEPMELVHVDYIRNGSYGINTRKTSGEECTGSRRSLYLVCTSLCDLESDSEDNHPGTL